MADAPDMSAMAEMPQIGIAVTPDYSIYLTIGFGLAWQQVYLCTPDNYEEVARKIHKAIMDAGREARRERSGLKVATGSEIHGIGKAQGGKQPGSGRSRP
jgi:hypothetical protein